MMIEWTHTGEYVIINYFIFGYNAKASIACDVVHGIRPCITHLKLWSILFSTFGFVLDQSLNQMGLRCDLILICPKYSRFSRDHLVPSLLLSYRL